MPGLGVAYRPIEVRGQATIHRTRTSGYVAEPGPDTDDLPVTARHVRPLVVGALVAVLLSACGIWANVGEDGDDCDLRPIGVAPSASGLSFGIQTVAALCAAMAEVDGRPYSIGAGRWLDESALVLEEYGLVTRANDHIADPQAFSLRGIDPMQFLIIHGDGRTDGSGEVSRYMTLWGEGAVTSPAMCQYADPADVGYPGDICPLRTGRTYTAGMVVRCGLEVPVGPYGGDYWMVVNPPPAPAEGQTYPGMYLDVDWGQVELIDTDTAVYRSERGVELELRRAGGASAPAGCHLADPSPPE